MKVFVTGFALSCAVFSGTAVSAAEPLVDAAWVKDNLGNGNVVFVDLRPQGAYLAGHIPGAVHSQYGGPKGMWRTKVDDVRGLVRKPDDLAADLGKLGISNDSHVVLVVAGSSSADIGTATRAYWTLKYLGDDNVSILNGGMASYLKQVGEDKKPVNPLEEGAVQPVSASFTASPRPEMLLSPEDVQKMAADGATLVDNRSHDYFLGINKSGAATKPGTLPGAVNFPHSWATNNGGGEFRDVEALKKLYAAAGVPTSGPQIEFCNTGHLATVGWFVSHALLGNEDAQMYDGSMAQWTHTGHDTERKVSY